MLMAIMLFRTFYLRAGKVHSYEINSVALAVISVAEEASVSAVLAIITAAMPSELHDPFVKADSSAAYAFARELVNEFDDGNYPSWLAQLPETAQSYFISRWMSPVLDQTDLLGSSSTVVTALVLTEGSGGVTSTVAGDATFA